MNLLIMSSTKTMEEREFYLKLCIKNNYSKRELDRQISSSYYEALDRQEKKINENPSVGIILCSSKNKKVVEYAMSRSMSPTMVANYTVNLIDRLGG